MVPEVDAINHLLGLDQPALHCPHLRRPGRSQLIVDSFIGKRESADSFIGVVRTAAPISWGDRNCANAIEGVWSVWPPAERHALSTFRMLSLCLSRACLGKKIVYRYKLFGCVCPEPVLANDRRFSQGNSNGDAPKQKSKGRRFRTRREEIKELSPHA